MAEKNATGPGPREAQAAASELLAWGQGWSRAVLWERYLQEGGREKTYSSQQPRICLKTIN